jgi:hypothetical protein
LFKHDLKIARCPIAELPARLCVEGDIRINDCKDLVWIGPGLDVTGTFMADGLIAWDGSFPDDARIRSGIISFPQSGHLKPTVGGPVTMETWRRCYRVVVKADWNAHGA